MRRRRKGVRAVKRGIRLLYVALVGLLVFTGALFIAQGMRENSRESNLEIIEIPRRAPDGPTLPV